MIRSLPLLLAGCVGSAIGGAPAAGAGGGVAEGPAEEPWVSAGAPSSGPDAGAQTSPPDSDDGRAEPGPGSDPESAPTADASGAPDRESGPAPEPEVESEPAPEPEVESEPAPEPEAAPDSSPEVAPGGVSLDVACDARAGRQNVWEDLDEWALDVSVPEGATGYLVAPFVPAGLVYNVELDGPGGRVDFADGYPHGNVNAELLRSVNPVLVPGGAGLAGLTTPGAYTLTVLAQQPPCRAVALRRRAGDRLDLNVYFVGLRDPGGTFDRALAVVGDVYGQAGLRLGAVRRFVLEGEEARRRSIVRSEEDVVDIGRLSRPPGPSAAERLSLNLFVVDQILLVGGGVLGVSAGLPGPAGRHGERGAGVVITAEVLGDVELLGRVVAHEGAHYLGLFHTTEAQALAADPVADTPECAASVWNDPRRCPDAGNLMFPFADVGGERLTAGQTDVLHANPMVQ